MDRPIVDFFIKPSPQSVDLSKYKELEMGIKICDAMSHLSNQSIYLIDYIRQTFLYVSPHPLFLCGHKPEDFIREGLNFFGKILPPDDLQMLLEMHQMAWRFGYTFTPEERMHLRISYDIYLQHKNGDKILINQRLAPLILTSDGQPWVTMGVVSNSSRKKAGNTIIVHEHKSLYYDYNFSTQRFEPYTPQQLTKREEELLRLSMQGYTEAGIAEKLNISVKTVRNHHQNAEKKLGVNSIANALGVFNLML